MIACERGEEGESNWHSLASSASETADVAQLLVLNAGETLRSEWGSEFCMCLSRAALDVTADEALDATEEAAELKAPEHKTDCTGSQLSCEAALASLGDDTTDSDAAQGDTGLCRLALRWKGIKCVFHLFFTALSERQGGPPRSSAISIHLFPRRACASIIIVSSSSVHGPGDHRMLLWCQQVCAHV
jgi:hypothetical protein